MRRKGFTLIEVLIILVVVAVLAAIVIPGLLKTRAAETNEAELKEQLATLYQAVEAFQEDTGCYPKRLGDLVCLANNPPAIGVGGNGEEIPILPAKYHGPYLQTGKLPVNPTTGGNIEGKDWHYQIEIRISSSPGRALNGTNYADW